MKSRGIMRPRLQPGRWSGVMMGNGWRAILAVVAAFGPIAAHAQPDVTSRGAIIVEAATGAVIWEYNADEVLPPASTTKVLTAILALQSRRLDDHLEVSEHAAATPPSKIGLRPGQMVTLRDLLYAVLLKSANDASVVVAEGISGSEFAFASYMNLKARVIGARDSNFENPHGLTSEGHLTTARDLSRLFRYGLGVPGFRDVLSTTSAHVAIEGPRARLATVRSHNRLLNAPDYQVIGKTGYTRPARRCFVGAAREGSREVVIAILGSSDLWGDARRMLEYGLGPDARPTPVLMASVPPPPTAVLRAAPPPPPPARVVRVVPPPTAVLSAAPAQAPPAPARRVEPYYEPPPSPAIVRAARIQERMALSARPTGVARAEPVEPLRGQEPDPLDEDDSDRVERRLAPADDDEPERVREPGSSGDEPERPDTRAPDSGQEIFDREIGEGPPARDGDREPPRGSIWAESPLRDHEPRGQVAVEEPSPPTRAGRARSRKPSDDRRPPTVEERRRQPPQRVKEEERRRPSATALAPVADPRRTGTPSPRAGDRHSPIALARASMVETRSARRSGRRSPGKAVKVARASRGRREDDVDDKASSRTRSPQGTGQEKFTVQLGPYRDRKAADTMRADLARRGYAAKVVGKTLELGNFADRNRANRLAGRLRTSGYRASSAAVR